MKLITKQQARYVKYICQGELESYKKNEALAKILECIATNNFDVEKGIEPFAAGLKSDFRACGYMDGDSTTALGEEIIEKKHVWDKLYGTFEIGTIQSENSKYIIQHQLYNGNFHEENTEKPNFRGEFICGDSHVRNLRLEKHSKKVESPVEIECTYDFGTNMSSYVATVKNQKFAFGESRESFQIIDQSEAESIVDEKLENYGLDYRNSQAVLVRYDEKNIPLKNAIEDIFSNGSFHHRDDDVDIQDIRVSIEEPDIAEELLLKYLAWNSEKRYCGKNEINRLICDFYTLFDNCAQVESGTKEIFDKLLNYTNRTNVTAYLHLIACHDLEPSNRIKHLARAVSLTEKKKTMKDVVKAMVGDHGNVSSVSIAEKFAPTNAAISRALCLFADGLKTEYGAKLNLYIIEDKNDKKASYEINKRFYDMLKAHENINFNTIPLGKSVHDRYYCVETSDGIYWGETTNELNALRYDNDYVGGMPREDIKLSTRGTMLDFTIIPLDEDDVRIDIKEMFGKK